MRMRLGAYLPGAGVYFMAQLRWIVMRVCQERAGADKARLAGLIVGVPFTDPASLCTGPGRGVASRLVPLRRPARRYQIWVYW